ncbi:MAG: hypothetical protein ACRDSH_23965 [Pseudonocardiaceae bacterium]
MAIQTPLFLQKTGADADVTYSATNYRLALIAGLCQFPGVIDPYGSNGLLVTQRGAGANFSVDVAAGYGIIQGGDVTLQGSYIAVNDATVNVATPSAPGSGTRIHRLVLQIRDKLNNGAYTTYDGQLQLLQDTGSGTPATPASALSLAKVSISAGQANVSNANITDDRAWARWALSNSGLLTVNVGYSASDATRQPRYVLTADGYCHLYGWQSSTGSGTANAGTFYQLAGPLPPQARPTGNRDCIMMSSKGVVDCLIQSNGNIYFTPLATFATAPGDWWSFEGLSFRVAS